MEINAAFMEHTDFHVGRVIDHLEELGELDNTLVIYLTADNGATAEGTPTGTISELLFQNGFPPLTMEEQLQMLEEYGGIEEWGGPHLHNHFSVAWAWSTSTPFQWTKQIGSHFGGTIGATAIRYPKMIKAKGEWRRQYQYVTDIFPTILEVTGVPQPDYVNGQKAMERPGKSLVYAWNDAGAKTNHPTQYHEMLGYMGIYHEGWTLGGKPYRVPEFAAPFLKSVDYEVNAYVTADKNTEGVIYAMGDRMGGQALFIKDGKLRYSFSTLGLCWHDFEGVEIPFGELKITLKHTMKEARANGPATVEFFINDEKVGEMDIKATVSQVFSAHETFDIGRDEGMWVNREYEEKGKFLFTPGQLHKVVFDIKLPEVPEVNPAAVTDMD
jgi:hypothetical protein